MAKPKKEIFCSRCKKKIELGEKYENVRWKNEDNSKGAGYWEGNNYCLPCYEIKKQEEKETEEGDKERKKQQELDKFETLSSECFKKIFELGLKAKNTLTVTDYREIKNLEKKLDRATKSKELADPLIKKEISKLQNSLQELEKSVPEPVKVQAKSQGKKCRHDGYVYWPRAKEEDPYCLNCGDNESDGFLRKLQKKQTDEIRGWLESKKLNPPSVLKDISYQQLNKLALGSFTNLEEIQSAYLELEKELAEIATKKGLNNPWNQYQQLGNSNNTREKEQIQQDINKLENKPDKTPEEERDLENKKKRLDELDKSNNTEVGNKSDDSNLGLYFGVGVMGLLVVGLVLFVIHKNKRK